MDGLKTVEELWDAACELGGDGIPTQDEMVKLLMQLHSNDLLYCDVTPDSAELFERYNKRKWQKWKNLFTQPLSIRIPLFNPDDMLSRWAHHFSWLFTIAGALLWIAIVVPALVLAGRHWGELTLNISDQVLSADNLLVLVLVFPLVKAVHELGHGFAAKVWGGGVHEMGIMFLVFAPIPYVDASSATTFRAKHRRAIVGAAGMLAEVFLAALAMYVWVLVEPGVVRAIAFNLMLIAGISTIVINGNPLLRYDGYFILSDLIEMPNLAQRGQKYLAYLSDRYLFGAKELTPPGDTRSEKAWFVGYSISSWLYRMFIMVTIILFVAGEFFIFGVILAIIAVIGLIGKPLWKAGKHLLESPTLHRYRRRAIFSTITLITLVVVFTSIVPMPLRTQAEGVVWLPDNALVRARSDGAFLRWLVTPRSIVNKGDALLVMENPELETEMKVARARVREVQGRYNVEQFTNPVEAKVLREQLEYEKKSLSEIEKRYNNLFVHSTGSGILTVENSHNMVGQFYRKGSLLGYVMDREQLVARVAVTQDDIGLVRSQIQAVEMRFVDSVPDRHRVSVIREVPSGLDELPTPALSPAGGGSIPVDPSDSKGLKTLNRIFFLDVSLPSDALPESFGSRVYVRFVHKSEPLASQAFRRIRQLLLSRFNV